MIATPPPLPTRPPPKVLDWFAIYARVLCLLYLLVAALGVFLLIAAPSDEDISPLEARLLGAGCLLIGLALFGACLLPLILRPRPWLWTYNLVVICVGMTSACFLPFCIPLLIFWLKPEVKAHFGTQ